MSRPTNGGKRRVGIKDVAEAAATLASTLETAARGVIYEHQAQAPPAQRLVRDLRATEFLARVIQHEVDHLNGVLFIDRMSRLKRIAIAGQLKRMKRETEAALRPE